MQNSLCDANNFEKDMQEKNNDIFVCDENLSITMLLSQKSKLPRLVANLLIPLIIMQSGRYYEQSAIRACYEECDEKQYVA